MNFWNLISLGSAIFFLWNLGRNKFNQVKDALDFGASDVTIKKVTPLRTRLIIHQEIYNGSQIAIPADSFSGWLFYKQYRVAPVSIPDPINLAPGESTTVDIHAEVDHLESLANFLSALSTDNIKEGDLILRGTVRKSGVEFQIEKIIDI